MLKALREAGVEEKQAEAQAAALATILKTGADDLATQRDIEQLCSEVKRDLDVLHAELKRDMAETKAELIRWVVGVGVLQTSLVVAIIARLAKVI